MAFISASAGEPFVIFVLAIFGTPFFLLLCWLWPKRWSSRSTMLGNRFVVPICLVLIASVAITHWPLRLQYFIARSKFNELAELVKSGPAPVMPMRIGLLRILHAETHGDDIVCLWTVEPPGFTGFEGFVQTSPDSVPFLLSSMVSLDDRWQFATEE